MSNPSVVVYGPAGCGKTTHADVLAKHYGLTTVIDDFEFRRTKVPPTGALLLCQGVPSRLPPGVSAYPYAHAISEAGRTKR